MATEKYFWKVHNPLPPVSRQMGSAAQEIVFPKTRRGEGERKKKKKISHIVKTLIFTTLKSEDMEMPTLLQCSNQQPHLAAVISWAPHFRHSLLMAWSASEVPSYFKEDSPAVLEKKGNCNRLCLGTDSTRCLPQAFTLRLLPEAFSALLNPPSIK